MDLFDQHIVQVKSLFMKLDRSEEMTFDGDLPSVPGIYVFLDQGIPERVGRSNNIRKRLKTHLRQDHNSGSYAFKRARVRYGTKATYRKETSRKALQNKSDFIPLFTEEIERLRSLKIKVIEVKSIPDQYLLEIYASIKYGLSMEEFGNS